MSFDRDIRGYVPAKGAIRLHRTTDRDVDIANMTFGYTEPGIRVLKVCLANRRIDRHVRQDDGKGVPIDCVSVEFPFLVPAHCTLSIDVHNPTDKPIGFRWSIEVKKTLYAVTLEREVSEGVFETDIVYCHALEPNEATRTVLASELHKNKVRVVATGKAIGFFADDKDEKVLKA